MSPEQEREQEAREECARLGIDPDDVVADGGVLAWMVVDQELRHGLRHHPMDEGMRRTQKIMVDAETDRIHTAKTDRTQTNKNERSDDDWF